MTRPTATRIGVDLVELRRFRALWEGAAHSQLRTVFTSDELAYACRKRDPVPSLAGRFAVKEAVLKLLGELDLFSCDLTEIAVVARPASRPDLVLSGAVADLASSLGVSAISISLSHTRQFALGAAFAATFEQDPSSVQVLG